MKVWSILVLVLIVLTLALWWSPAEGVAAPQPGATSAEGSVGDARPANGSFEVATDRETKRREQRVSRPAEPTGTGSLHVVVRRDGAGPAAGVPVALAAMDGRDVRASVRSIVTDASGEVHVPALAVGTWRLSIGFEIEQTAGIRPDETTRVELTLRNTTTATIKTVDEAGSPVADAEVLLWLADRYFDAPRWQPGVVVGRTDGRGELALAGVSQRFGNGSWVQARAAGLGASLARMIPVVGDETEQSGSDPVVLTVSRRQAVATVIVVDAAARPIDAAEVALRAVDAPTSKVVGDTRATPFVAQDGRTDAQGIARFAPVANGRWQVAVRAHGHGMAVAGFSVRDGAARDVRVALGAGCAIAGLVTNGGGEPLAGAEVTVRVLGQKLHATTGKSGRFSFADLPEGLADWAARCDGHVAASGSVDVTAASPARLDIALQPLTSLRGHLSNEAGDALVGWRVTCNAKLPGYGTDRRKAVSDEEGSFELLVRPDAAYKLHVTAPDTTRPIRPPAFQHVRATDAPLQIVIGRDLLPSAYVSLRLVDQNGRVALAGLTDVTRGGAGAALPVAARDETSGLLRIGPLLPGTCVLQLSREDGFEFRLPEFELVADADRSLGEVAWPLHGTLTIAVQRLPDTTPGDVLAELQGPFGQRQLRIDQKSLRGSVAIMPGSWSVTVYGDGFRSSRAVCDVIAGQETERHVARQRAVRVPIRVIKPKAETTLRGEILLPDGTQLFDFEIAAGQSHDDWAPQLSVDEYRIEAVGGSGRRYRASLRVATLAANSERRSIEFEPVDGR